ncbi:hypothetical protein G6F46_008173 [Rhizopus delemar]|uniref:Cytochrome P450 n=2 Tax=Rhizopus TaxID=4842 RepID=A0A9P6YZG1_9FUNG|nr:hypothetical protein G6F55_007088 [Rhizopus delemar]KAG1540530.1 hypothetical protein G6F51_008464 [Rhizopus arrhizus]KAG1494743.1 hypothetical protein G6F54_007658 [Rhizopus delemar]KAG1508781.1 hypothetical protein G6F53_007932 [Rhizopus delemar]KAG1524384.1 hypothetical protein G6F52_004232 [Rhizopus delemar]
MDTNKLKETAFIIVPASAALLSIAYLSRKGKSEEKKGLIEIPFPPNATNLPIFGHMFGLGKCPSKQITQWHKEIGPIYKLRMGNQLWFMISDPLLAHDIFVKAGSSTSSRPYHRFLIEIYSKNNRGISMAQTNHLWKNKRKAATTILSPGSVDKFSDILEAEVDQLVDRFAKYSESGEALDPFKELQLSSLNVILALVLATRFESTDTPDFKTMHRCINDIMIFGGPAGDIGSFLPMLAWIDMFTGVENKMRNFVNIYRDDFFMKLIDNALKKNQRSLVKDLYQMKEEGLIDEDDILVFTSDLIGAGADTVATTIYWAFAILSQMPEVQSKLMEELDEWKSKHAPGAIPSFNKDRDDLPYSICVQKEIMRFRPATNFGVVHMASEDVIVNKYFIPKDTILVSSMAAMHKNPEFYEDPDEFKPERFLNNTNRMGAASNAKIEDRDHFGFGWGRRICPGIHLAEKELFNFFVRFFSKFTIETELDSQGQNVKLNLDDYVEEGIMCKPLPCKYRIISRKV